jgi:hypothetical protein
VAGAASVNPPALALLTRAVCMLLTIDGLVEPMFELTTIEPEVMPVITIVAGALAPNKVLILKKNNKINSDIN